MPKPTKLHYHLVSGSILFKDKDSGEVGSINLNSMLSSVDGTVPSRQIGRAQQSLQMMMFKRLDDPTVEVIDVFITGISYLGHMTEEDFAKPPEGMVKQEVTAFN